MFSQMQFRALAVLATAASLAQAQHVTLASASRDLSAVHAAHVSTSSLRVDGVLTESVWRAVTPSTAFVQTEPGAGSPATKATDVRMIITDDAVYIGAHLSEDPATFAKRTDNRAEPSSFRDDYFEVQLDPHPGHFTALSFAVSPNGTKQSWLVARDGSRDQNWDIRWDAATQVDKDGWTIEIRVPLSEFHVAAGNEQWAAQFVRFSYARQETDVLSHAAARSTTVGER